MCADSEQKRLILIGSLQGLFICFYDSWQHEINQQRLSETSRVDIPLWSIPLLFKFSPEDWDRGTDKGLLKSRLPNQLKNIWITRGRHSDSFQAPPQSKSSYLCPCHIFQLPILYCQIFSDLIDPPHYEGPTSEKMQPSHVCSKFETWSKQPFLANGRAASFLKIISEMAVTSCRKTTMFSWLHERTLKSLSSFVLHSIGSTPHVLAGVTDICHSGLIQELYTLMLKLI